MQENEDIIKVLKIIQAINKQNKSDNIVVKEYSNPNIRSIKVAIPYMSIQQQKPLYIMLKIMEINEYITKYRELSTATIENNSDFRRGVLMALREQVTDEQKRVIDTFIKMFEISKAMNMEMNQNA